MKDDADEFFRTVLAKKHHKAEVRREATTMLFKSLILLFVVIIAFFNVLSYTSIRNMECKVTLECTYNR